MDEIKQWRRCNESILKFTVLFKVVCHFHCARWMSNRQGIAPWKRVDATAIAQCMTGMENRMSNATLFSLAFVKMVASKWWAAQRMNSKVKRRSKRRSRKWPIKSFGKKTSKVSDDQSALCIRRVAWLI